MLTEQDLDVMAGSMAEHMMLGAAAFLKKAGVHPSPQQVEGIAKALKASSARAVDAALDLGKRMDAQLRSREVILATVLAKMADHGALVASECLAYAGPHVGKYP